MCNYKRLRFMFAGIDARCSLLKSSIHLNYVHNIKPMLVNAEYEAWYHEEYSI